jgi:hypothetical protein
MKAYAKHLMKLLEKICDKTGQELGHAGLVEAAWKIGGMSDKYIYKSIYNRILGKKDNYSIRLNDKILNKLAAYIGYSNYQAFVKSIDHPIDPTIVGAEGVYMSYVRMNSDEGKVLCSPARIIINETSSKFELRGPKWTYRGDVKLEGGCLFVSMHTEVGKSFHHVYKIGKAHRPRILQGIFSGVSSAFDPIAGRCVLVRADVEFGTLKNESVSIATLRSKPGKVEKALAKYFKDRSLNNLIVEGITTNDIPDLVRGRST